jgi:hypothetical protein
MRQSLIKNAAVISALFRLGFPASSLAQVFDTLGMQKRFDRVMTAGTFVTQPNLYEEDLWVGKQLTGTLTQDEWDTKNKRRCWLIDKQLANKLTRAEASELQQLEDEMSSHLDLVAPLPFEALGRLEEIARRITEDSHV